MLARNNHQCGARLQACRIDIRVDVDVDPYLITI
jgi:hypothetical protein